MDQYMALSKKDLTIHITMNELYNTHSLILQHVETLVSIPDLSPVLVSDGCAPVSKRQAAFTHLN